MKQVTIDNVRERIAELNCLSRDGVLSLRGEFELACLRQLVASMDGKPFMYGIADPDGAAHMDEFCVSTSIAGIEDAVNALNEECEEGGPLYRVVPLYRHPAPPAPVAVPDVLPLADSKDLTTAQLQSIINDDWLLMDDCEGMQNCAAVKTLARMALKSDTNDYLCDSAYVSGMQAGWNFGVVEDSSGFQSSLEHYRKGMREYRAALRNQTQEPATDNTAQQFEALGTSKAKPTDALKIPEGLHPDTADLVMRFATALAEKLHRAEQKYGYANGWKASGWYNECLQQLWEHIEKGDPRDVAAYCAFMWHHGWVTTDYDRGVQQALATSAGSGKP